MSKNRDGSVGIATCYGLDGPGSNPGGVGRDFPHPPARCTPGHFPLGEETGAWR